MTPAERAQVEWTKAPRRLTEPMAYRLDAVLPDDTGGEGAVRAA